MAVLQQGRQGTAGEAIDGITPRLVAEPSSGAACAAVLAAAAAGRVPTVVRGGGTKSGWGRPIDAVDLVVSTKSLADLLVHRDGDLTVTAGAGLTLARLNTALSARGQWLPVDSAFVGTTIGGALATNDSGPLRHRFGTPRDLLIGITLALTDGRVVKAGGTVVKNVAGYDLGKLISGSHGSLAAIVSATFKLSPQPGASSTLVATFEAADALMASLAAITGSQLEAAAIEVHAGSPRAGPYQLLLKFESTPGALNAHVRQARALAGGATCEVVAAQSEADLWRAHLRSPWQSPGMIVKFAWMPASLGAVLALVDDLRASVTGIELTGRAAIGSGLLRVDADPRVQRNVVERLRSRTDVFRHVVVLRADAAVKQQLDVWGPLGDAGALGASVKHALDPHGILNAGRGPV
jgi:glycolate oxidase FAD binding subunit